MTEGSPEIEHFAGFKNQSEFQYSAGDIRQYLETFKKCESLHATTPTPSNQTELEEKDGK
ncbi:MAG: hypothetical protein PHU54_08720 [Candidatus Omnitrophica bacterium]|jgi:hypothetical protein|nr:hypothetical protein [Candidatus Omnitrophota bacterium]